MLAIRDCRGLLVWLVVVSVMKRKQSQDFITPIFIMVFTLLLCIVIVVQLSTSGVMGFGGRNYLYNPSENPKLGETAEDVFPIVDYVVSSEKSDDETTKEYEDRITHPDMIYGENNGPRVVEFYSPWCSVRFLTLSLSLRNSLRTNWFRSSVQNSTVNITNR